MYIVDQNEHGNGGVCGYTTLDNLSLEEALKKCPQNYGVFTKEWGFWPVIRETEDAKNPLFRWDEDTAQWKDARRSSSS